MDDQLTDPDATATTTGRSRSTGSALVVVAVAAVAVVANWWWIAARRRGLPFDVDEAGYLQRAVRNADALHAGGMGRLVQVVRVPDPQAPLLPGLGGMVRWLTGTGPYGLLAVQAVFTVLLVVSTYLAARSVGAPRWAALAAVVVATLPGVIDNGRGFEFALAASALLTAALAAQLWAGDFRSTPRSLLWGALVGLAALSRTMVLGLLPGLLLALAVRLGAEWFRATRSTAGRSVPSRARPLANAAAGSVVAFAVAWSWYSASGGAVWRYLTTYGYGARSVGYGPARAIWSWRWWTTRLTSVVQFDLHWPFALALAVCVVLGSAAALRRRRRRRRGPAVSSISSPPPSSESARGSSRWTSPVTTVVLYLVTGYLLLSSTRNTGLFFELPLVPAAVILVMVAASRAAEPAWRVALVVCLAAAVFSLAGQSGLVPGSSSTLRTLSVGPVTLPVLDSRGGLVRYAEAESGRCPTTVSCGREPSARAESAELRAWSTAVDRVAVLVHDQAAARGRSPVIFFGVQDALFNTNSVDLAYQLAYHGDLSTGLLRDPSIAGSSLAEQLDAPASGQPNLVVIGPPATAPLQRAFGPPTDEPAAQAALQASGFARIASVTLPDGRVVQLWWKERGPGLTTGAG